MSLGFFERDGPAGIIFRYDMRYMWLQLSLVTFAFLKP